MMTNKSMTFLSFYCKGTPELAEAVELERLNMSIPAGSSEGLRWLGDDLGWVAIHHGGR